MQLILISNRLGTAKSLVLSARQLTFGAAGAALFVLLAATALTVFALQQTAAAGGAAVQHLLPYASVAPRTPAGAPGANLDAMATKIGQLQAQTTVLELKGESIAALAGVKPHEFRFDTLPGLGGPAPAAASGLLSLNELERVLDRLALQVGNRADNLDYLEYWVLDYAGRKQLMPTMLPVRDAQIGSGFGMRTDPFTGQPAMHEGLDFAAEVGTPIRAAGGGIVVFAGFHREFGNLIEIDHGNGIITRYGHCSRLNVKEGDIVLPGQIIAAVGGTGHATGPHLHFEIRYKGVAQNPGKYLQADLRKLRKVAGSRSSNQG